MHVFGGTVLVLTAWLCALGAVSTLTASMIAAPAWADDGDGGDGDGDDGDDGDDGGGSSSSSSTGGGASRGGINSGEVDDPREIIRGLRRLFRGQPVEPQRARRRPAPQPVARPERAPAEIVARGLTDDQTTALVTQGYVVLERADLVSLATTVRRFQVPEGTTLDAARDTIRALPGAEAADFNHYYRAGQDSAAVIPIAATAPACDGLHCPARALIGWPQALGPEGCGAPVMIGMVDTGLNADHEVLAGADIDLTRIAPEEYSASAAIHGTAVAAILVGDPETRVPGLLPGLPLVAVDAFHRSSDDERTDAFTLVRALDHLSERGVQVINLSLAGPPNTVLEDTLLQLTEQRRIPVIAAAGNDGPRAEPAYPAAYDSVIAVTAVDRSGTIYRRAIRGAHVELAAPGVEVWTAASVKGAHWKTGTSFAAPYVTAAVALWLQHDPMLTPEEIRARLTASAGDRGPDGLDDTYGHGLLNLGGICPGQAAILPASAE
ncbi:MAG: S8 family serine peptidase [Roseovarius sp.]|uniref:S8 family serine peptidase n=1 Tax=Roseovarius sp. TaxID=1486281 RepID=UPI0032EBFAAF